MINDKITAADIMNYEYCPRIVYFIRVLKLPQTKSIKQIKGLEKDFSFKRDTNRTKIIKKYEALLIKKYNVPLQYEEFATKVDCIAFDKENNIAFPIQLKDSFEPRRVYATQKIQLMLEGLLIEKIWKYAVPYGYIRYLKSNSLVRVWFNGKERLFEVADKTKEIIEKEKFPQPTSFKKRCVNCCYRRVC